MTQNSLTIVGTGIQFVGHVTLATKAHIEQADKVLFAVADPALAEWLKSLNSTAEPLVNPPQNYQRRREMHQAMVAKILTEVRLGKNVCAVFYGHPGVFVDPAHMAIRQVRQEGFQAQMLPGISAEDCLFADLGVDPGKNGCQSFEATDFLIRPRRFDTHTALILWQVALTGFLGVYQGHSNKAGLIVLTDTLSKHYSPDHMVFLYEAAVYPISHPVIQPIPLRQLADTPMKEFTTLYIPPEAKAPLNQAMIARLGLDISKG